MFKQNLVGAMYENFLLKKHEAVNEDGELVKMIKKVKQLKLDA